MTSCTVVVQWFVGAVTLAIPCVVESKRVKTLRDNEFELNVTTQPDTPLFPPHLTGFLSDVFNKWKSGDQLDYARAVIDPTFLSQNEGKRQVDEGVFINYFESAKAIQRTCTDAERRAQGLSVKFQGSQDFQGPIGKLPPTRCMRNVRKSVWDIPKLWKQCSEHERNLLRNAYQDSFIQFNFNGRGSPRFRLYVNAFDHTQDANVRPEVRQSQFVNVALGIVRYALSGGASASSHDFKCNSVANGKAAGVLGVKVGALNQVRFDKLVIYFSDFSSARNMAVALCNHFGDQLIDPLPPLPFQGRFCQGVAFGEEPSEKVQRLGLKSFSTVYKHLLKKVLSPTLSQRYRESKDLNWFLQTFVKELATDPFSINPHYTGFLTKESLAQSLNK